MPRNNHPRKRGAAGHHEYGDLSRLLDGWRRTEVRREREWHVQPAGGASAIKNYTCPGCGGVIAPGVAHVVVWRADGVTGDTADLEARRHWHSGCWRIV
ncbi:hypothetical protein GCM10028798_18670 [Humibacter antri]